MILNPNFLDLLKCLNSAEVKYLVIGGYAVNFHGFHRNTMDFDVWIECSSENAERISKAMIAFGFGPASVTPNLFLDREKISGLAESPCWWIC